MVGAVPDARAVGDRLLAEDLLGVVHVEAPEVDELTGAVDLGLERGLRLAQHRGCVDPLPPRAGQQVGCLQQDRATLVEGHRPPVVRRIEARLHRRLGVLARGVLQDTEHVLMVVRLHDRDLGSPAVASPAVDVRPQRVLAPFLPFELRHEGGALGTAGGVGQVGLVGGRRWPSDRVHPATVTGTGQQLDRPTAEQVRDLLGGEPGEVVVRVGVGTAVGGVGVQRHHVDQVHGGLRIAHLGHQHRASPGRRPERRRGVGGGHQGCVLGVLGVALGDHRVDARLHRGARQQRPQHLERRGKVDPHHSAVVFLDGVRLRPRGARVLVDDSSSSSSASRRQVPNTSMSGRRSRSAVSP